ncbi:NAD(P)/FAD-dependent oxidoreductase [Salipaludibacillus agaradhaerens]|uniref:NAD(P)/FAD-dependent oxidoreductase n=1 Tax=Salipaludibacillus agaradhaerens TaxID=76935 RepID=A0A9Q4AZ53_SALAG|nr:NAD(P)/FAD-dependent oxidoreductase [Salipaludibacillus agaradhaerens]MCR6095452.1 NAD(P)/FAD-dependent oxidoreductase [Salipaludibacillus agaradhaerens]MCR6114988.1 NAD(P)/FAD-dependent oxidoreductase [Salipaludibacillus agaradhaerens]
MTDVIIIGGGPAGLMAAVAAAEHGATVLLLDKGKKLGRKLAISGGGRCNVTNRADIEDIITHIPGNGRFMHSPFSIFNNEDIIAFFESLGIKLKEEDRGRMFPVNDKAVDVVRALLNKIRSLNVSIRTNTEVCDILYDPAITSVTGVLLKNGEKLETNRVIIAVGGKSVPHTGSTGDGYPWAVKAGHTVTDLYPTEVPITCHDAFIKAKTLQGLSLRDVQLSVLDPKKRKVIKAHEGDMIFTHFGVSGPISLRCSQYVVKARKKHPDTAIPLQVDLFPMETTEDVLQQLVQLLKEQSKKAIKNALQGFLPERLIPILLEMAHIEPLAIYPELAHAKLRELAQLIKGFPLTATGTLSIEKAFVTGGGVSVKEIQPKRMESKLVKGLFFCGEVLDLHGYTGGYNITVAFSTGYTAGKAAAGQ